MKIQVKIPIHNAFDKAGEFLKVEELMLTESARVTNPGVWLHLHDGSKILVHIEDLVSAAERCTVRI